MKSKETSAVLEIDGLRIVKPEKGDSLNQPQLEKLLPYVRYAIDKKIKNRVLAEIIQNSIIATETGISFQRLSEVASKNLSQLLNKVIEACNAYIKAVVIIHDEMNVGPTINHRVFNFSANQPGSSIFVKYVTLDDYNFDAAIDILANLYPDAKNLALNEECLTTDTLLNSF